MASPDTDRSSYAELAAHYGTAILPVTPYKPRHKPKVEVALQVAQRWILARLWNGRFFTLTDPNGAIRQLVDELNMRVMRSYGASRADLIATRPPTSATAAGAPYEFVCWKRCRVAPDYHVEAGSTWYSVPLGLIRQEVDVRICGATVEIFHSGSALPATPATEKRLPPMA